MAPRTSFGLFLLALSGLLLALGLWASSLPAEPLAQERPQPALLEIQPRAGSRFDLRAERAELIDILDAIGSRGGENILVDPNLSQEVTLVLRDVTWQEAVEALAKRFGFEVHARSGALVLVPPPVLVTLVETCSALEALQRLAGERELRLPKGFPWAKELTLSLVDVEWHQAVLEVVEASGDYLLLSHDPIHVVHRSSLVWSDAR